MILIYSQHPLNEDEKDKQRNLIKDRLSMFFIDDDDFLFSTESSPQLIKELITHHKIYLFITESISSIGLQLDDLIEVIRHLLKNKGCFRSEVDNLSFCEDDIDKVGSVLSRSPRIQSFQ